MRSKQDIESFLKSVLEPGYKESLVARGDARSKMQKNGVPLEGSPIFSPSIESDLINLGYSIIEQALKLREEDKANLLLPKSFKLAGDIFCSVITNCDSTRSDKGYLCLLSSCSYHLGGFSAIAYSMLKNNKVSNLNPSEKCLTFLIIRDLEGLRKYSFEWLNREEYQEEILFEKFQTGKIDFEELFSVVINTSNIRALAIFEFFLQTGKSQVIEDSHEILYNSLQVAQELGFVHLWWIIRLIKVILSDLFENSLHKILPLTVPKSLDNFTTRRSLYISSLFLNSISQVELWPSQIEAAKRAFDHEDDLVVSLPTSAGKTRIAELAALACLSMGKRVLILTPLRALSSQTEKSFTARFSPLGATVSSLYGSGSFASNEASMRKHDIVIATPEKLDYALRSDPDIINDIGLIVLDEGHLIGPSSRGILFECLIQQLLLRNDANARRIICLSAILPMNNELLNFTGWLRRGKEGGPVRSDWRPTTQNFGFLDWNKNNAILRYQTKNDVPFLPNFIIPLEPRGKDRTNRPKNKKEFTVIAAWKFALDGINCLIYCPIAKSAISFSKTIIELENKGYISSFYTPIEKLNDLLVLGEEYLGKDNAILECIKIGVAIHYGSLPTPYLRALEDLIKQGLFRIIIASPTLAQGLNLSVAVLLIPSLYRNQEIISSTELLNVSGRVGRAFVDKDGLILKVSYLKDKESRADSSKVRKEKEKWKELVLFNDARGLQSGLAQIIAEAMEVIFGRNSHISEVEFESLANNRDAWEKPINELEKSSHLVKLVEKLDLAILSLIRALETDHEALYEALDQALESSLWWRETTKIKRKEHHKFFFCRAKLIWSHTTVKDRKSLYAMGVGLTSWVEIKSKVETIDRFLKQANIGAHNGNIEVLVPNVIALADELLKISPFANTDQAVAHNWKIVLDSWLRGYTINDSKNEVYKLIEDRFIYRLVWSIEAFIRRQAVYEGQEYEFSQEAVACIETGLPDYRMALLVQAGLNSRNIAQEIVTELNPTYYDSFSMKSWVRKLLSLQTKWNWELDISPKFWVDFCQKLFIKEAEWSIKEEVIPCSIARVLAEGMFRVRVINKVARAYTLDFRYLGVISEKLKVKPNSISFGKKINNKEVFITVIGENTSSEIKG